MANLWFEGAAYLHHCLKVEAADDIGTCDNCNFQNEYLERFLSNLLQIIIYFQKLEHRIFREITVSHKYFFPLYSPILQIYFVSKQLNVLPI